MGDGGGVAARMRARSGLEYPDHFPLTCLADARHPLPRGERSYLAIPRRSPWRASSFYLPLLAISQAPRVTIQPRETPRAAVAAHRAYGSVARWFAGLRKTLQTTDDSAAVDAPRGSRP